MHLLKQIAHVFLVLWFLQSCNSGTRKQNPAEVEEPFPC